jgi:hypothetical protein
MRHVSGSCGICWAKGRTDLPFVVLGRSWAFHQPVRKSAMCLIGSESWSIAAWRANPISCLVAAST